MMRGETLLILGHGIKGQGQLGTLCIKTCGHNTDYSFCPITFKLHMYIVHDERINTIDFGLWGTVMHSVYKTLWAQYRLQFLSDHFQTSHEEQRWPSG